MDFSYLCRKDNKGGRNQFASVPVFRTTRGSEYQAFYQPSFISHLPSKMARGPCTM